MPYANQYAIARNILIAVAAALTVAATHAGTEPLTFQELMRFCEIDGAVISKCV